MVLTQLGALCAAQFAEHADRCRAAALYLTPALALAVLIRMLSTVHPVFLLLRLSGTLCHELAHFIVGLVTGARPASLSIMPRRAGGMWQLGAVTLANARWYNAAPAALAPLLVVSIPLLVAWWRTRTGLRFDMLDVGLALALAPQFLSFWPSWADWKIAARSWPYAVLGLALWQLAMYADRIP